jgi:hypothetical protein
MSSETNAAGEEVPQWWIDKGNSANAWEANHGGKKRKAAPHGGYTGKKQ